MRATALLVTLVPLAVLARPTLAALLVPPAPPALSPPQASAEAPRIPLDLSAAAGVYERRGAGLLVVDFKDSTPLHLALGNRAAHVVVAAALDYTEASAALFDGVVIRRLGDGQLIVFPRLKDAQMAAEAIQNGLERWRRTTHAPPLALRAAVHGGRVLIDASGERPEIYGQSVETALRLSTVGRGGDIARETAAGRAAVSAPERREPPSPTPGLQASLATAKMTRAAVLFAGLADFISAYERFGRRLAYATVKAFHEHVRLVVEELGGRVVKTEGETVMAAFDSAEAAARAGARIQERLPSLRRAAPLGPVVSARVGLTYGRVLRQDSLEGPDYFGNRVNAAARLMRSAEPGQVLASDSLLADENADAALMSARREKLVLKGFAEPVGVLRLRPRPAAEDPALAARLTLTAERAAARVKRAP